ncbi:hypothetical protein IAU59_004993 [Kwoniella sp. CBS 9459]
MPAMAVNSFMGCYISPEDLSQQVSSDDFPELDSAGCASVCQKYYQVHYSMYQASSGQCFCSDTSPRALDPNYDPSITSGSVDGCTDQTAYHTYMIGTTMTLEGQFASVTRDGPNENPGGAATVQECFSYCVDSTAVTVHYAEMNGYFFCYCTPPVSTGAASSDRGSYLVYSHPAGAYANEASTFVRRQLRERIQIARNRALSAICPNSLTACKVSSADDASFECIDTRSELESCGGCVHGEFNNATTIIGTDCSNNVGVPLGASTCRDGQCVAFACKKGYTLVDDQCIA